MMETVSFHTFKLPQDSFARPLVKNLGRGPSESVMRKELETLDIRVQRSRSCVPAAAIRPQPRTVLSTPLHCIGGAGPLGVQSGINHRTQRPASVGVYVPPKRPNAMQTLQALRPHAAKLRIRALVRCVWGLPPLWWVLYTAGVVPVLRLRGQPHGELPRVY